MKNRYDIGDDEIRIIGKKSNKVKYWVITAICMPFVAVALIFCYKNREEKSIGKVQGATLEVADKTESSPLDDKLYLGSNIDSEDKAFMELRDTVVNDISLRISIPHNATMGLHIGEVPDNDKNIIYISQAADVRADNGGIVGAFVIDGELKAKGLSKRGYCAVVDGHITIGVAESSPLFERAVEQGGCFFRQYPLVDNGKIVENSPKNRSVRRSICDRMGEIFMVETFNAVSFYEFSQALVDLGVDNAIYLVGGRSYGWAVDIDGVPHTFGDPEALAVGCTTRPQNSNYIIWR